MVIRATVYCIRLLYIHTDINTWVKTVDPFYLTVWIKAVPNLDLNKGTLTFFLGVESLYKDRSSHMRCSIKKVWLKVSKNSYKNTSVRVSLLIQNTPGDCFFEDVKLFKLDVHCRFAILGMKFWILIILNFYSNNFIRLS